jgi:hypothetical protein
MKDTFEPSMAMNPSDPRTVYCGAEGIALFKSADGTATWTQAGTGQGIAPYVHDLAVDPSTPLTMYLASAVQGILKSPDGGATWNPFNSGFPSIGASVLKIDPSNPSILYAVVPQGLFKSTNGASNWSPASTGLPTPAAAYVDALAIDPTTPSILYAGTWGAGVYKSIDGAGHWSPSSFHLPANSIVLSVTIDPQSPNTIYVSLDQFSSIWKTIDGGKNWAPTSSSLPYYVETLAVDPSNSNVVYAGTTAAGVFKSIDGGVTWGAFNVGMENASITRILIDPKDPRHVYASSGSGVFEIRQGPLKFYPITPCRVIDTRRSPSPLGGPALNANEDRDFAITGRCGIPAKAAAVSANITVTQPSDRGSVTIYPADTLFPLTRSIDFAANQTRANRTIIQLGAGGDFLIRASLPEGTVHFITDINGYFQ